MSYNVAVVGATGNVGREILSILHQRKFPLNDLIPLASAQSTGKKISYGEVNGLVVRDLAGFDFKNVDLVLASAGAELAKYFAPQAIKAGSVVIDNSSAFRMDTDVPLIVPEVNGEILANIKKPGIIASPNCIAIPLSTVLAPLHRCAPIKRVVISTYQSTSGAGKKVMDELLEQTCSVVNQQKVIPQHLSHQIAFNVIPQIEDIGADGFTGEETKVIQETKKIISAEFEITATCVRVPVFIGHAMAVNIEFAAPLLIEDAQQCLQQAPNICLSENHNITTPLDCVSTDQVFVSRLRRDPTVANGLNMWIVADNLRKGAALNAVQIAEKVIGG